MTMTAWCDCRWAFGRKRTRFHCVRSLMNDPLIHHNQWPNRRYRTIDLLRHPEVVTRRFADVTVRYRRWHPGYWLAYTLALVAKVVH